jgi:hypothetical protein
VFFIKLKLIPALPAQFSLSLSMLTLKVSALRIICALQNVLENKKIKNRCLKNFMAGLVSVINMKIIINIKLNQIEIYSCSTHKITH